jgi:putative sigma-54 modulation protein
MEISEAVKSYAEEKIKRIKKYLPDPIDVHVILEVEKIRHSAEITIVTNGITIYAEEETQDMYSAIDAVIDKIERQVKRYKDKIKRKKVHHGGKKSGAQMRVLSAENFEFEESDKVVKNRSFFAKPMSVDEAAMQMDLLHNDFLVFTNATSDDINVIYRRKDGKYGLIEPHGAE